jgi:hypothetical protein
MKLKPIAKTTAGIVKYKEFERISFGKIALKVINNAIATTEKNQILNIIFTLNFVRRNKIKIATTNDDYSILFKNLLLSFPLGFN